MSTISGQHYVSGISRDRHLLVTMTADDAQLWNSEDPRHLRPLGTLTGHHPATVTQAVISDDHRIAATVAYDREVVLWNITDPRMPRFLSTLELLDEEVVTATLRPDGKVLVTGDNSNGAVVWDISIPTHPQQLTVLRENFSQRQRRRLQLRRHPAGHRRHQPRRPDLGLHPPR
jgi:WD40 repeat protein